MTTHENSNSVTSPARLEHVNINVTDPQRTAALLHRLFDWTVRWEGDSMYSGYTIHIGSQTDYIALYSNEALRTATPTDTKGHIGLNHIAVVVDDLTELQARVRAEGLDTYNFGDYEPGRRFYFRDHDGFEYEVVSYSV